MNAAPQEILYLFFLEAMFVLTPFILVIFLEKLKVLLGFIKGANDFNFSCIVKNSTCLPKLVL